jgi:hypothetical protein
MTESDAPDDLEPARAAFRPAAEYLLRSLVMLAELADGDLLTGLISLAIVQANVAHLDVGEPDSPYATISDIPPDVERRPVSVMAISAAMRMPYETVRRHVAKMVRDGHCERRPNGVIVPVSALSSPRHKEMLMANLGNLRRLSRALKRLGV